VSITGTNFPSSLFIGINLSPCTKSTTRGLKDKAAIFFRKDRLEELNLSFIFFILHLCFNERNGKILPIPLEDCYLIPYPLSLGVPPKPRLKVVRSLLSNGLGVIFCI